jgi:hypothetical protein
VNGRLAMCVRSLTPRLALVKGGGVGMPSRRAYRIFSHLHQCSLCLRLDKMDRHSAAGVFIQAR